MPRVRVSTTVDAELLESARKALATTTDAAMLDEALAALIERHRAAEIDATYAAYDEHPLDEPDEWGDLASFRKAAAAS
jgi:hypothetical protein